MNRNGNNRLPGGCSAAMLLVRCRPPLTMPETEKAVLGRFWGSRPPTLPLEETAGTDMAVPAGPQDHRRLGEPAYTGTPGAG